MRLRIALLLLAAWATTSVAEEMTFFEKETDNFWAVAGAAESNTGQATCYARAKKKDGSFIQIHRSLVNGELWAIIRNTDWDFVTNGKAALRWNFYRSLRKDSLIDGGDFEYEVKNKDTILILDIKSKRLIEVMWSTRYFTLVMPGNLSNLSFSFERAGSATVNALSECIKLNEQKYKDFKPTDKVPDAIRDRI